MPIGEYQYSLDDKGRVIIPPSFREFVADGMVITRGMDGCLFIFPTVKWSEIVTKLNDLSMMDPASRNFQRFFYSGASKATLDTAGRITLPSSLRTTPDSVITPLLQGHPITSRFGMRPGGMPC
jgi:MraZ protein